MCINIPGLAGNNNRGSDKISILEIQHGGIMWNFLLNSSVKCPEAIHRFFSFRDELSVCNGIVLKGHNRIVVPESL